MDHVLGTGPGFTSRISKKLRDEDGLCYSVSAGVTSSAGTEPGVFAAYMGTKAEGAIEKALTSGLGEKLDVVVRFLAVLELFKQGYVELDQLSSFGDLTVTWLGVTDVDGQLALSGADLYEG